MSKSLSTTTTTTTTNQGGSYLSVPSIESIRATVESYLFPNKQQQSQQSQEQQQQQQETALQSVWNFFKNHPKLTKAILTPLLIAGLKKTISFVSKLYKSNTVLELDLTRVILSEKPLSSLDKLMDQKKIWYREVIEALEYATKDPKIIGLIVKIGGSTDSAFAEVGFGQTDELREAVLAFSKTKLSICYADVVGDAETSTKATRQYYFASAFREIYVIPAGLVVIPGLLIPGLFVKNTLSKLEIEPQMLHREEYKTAINMFTEEKFDQPHREQIQSILDGLINHIVQKIAEARKVSETEVKQWFEQGVFTPTEAKERGVIDGILFRDQIYESLPEKLSLTGKQKPNFLFLTSYYQKKGRMYEKGNQEIALIFAQGGIVRGEEEASLFGGSETTIYAETIARHIRNARNDKNVKAIVFRVESPGGDAIASDIINREIVLAKKAGKKVIVSMGSVAGSGGYWISMNADRIVCNPLGITGSIGVIFGKFYTRNFWENKLGITFDDVRTSDRSTIFSSVHSFDDDQWQVSNKLIDFYYDEFKRNVAEGRKIDIQQVAQIAKGQIYLGIRAKEIGLVDRVGGLKEAIEDAKELIGFDESKDKLKVTVYPKPKNLLQLLAAKKAQNSEQRDKNASVAINLASPFTQSIAFMNTFRIAWSTLFGTGGLGSGVQASLSGTPFCGTANGFVDMLSSSNSEKVMLQDPLLSLFKSM